MNIPYHKQATDYTCGPASLRMVYEYLGHYVSEEELASKLHTTPEVGTVSDNMSIPSLEYGFFTLVQHGKSTIVDIKYFLSMNMPVIVDFIEISREDRHFAVIVGQENNNFTMNDPWNGEKILIHIEEFDRHWSDARNRYVRWMMVVSREPIIGMREFA